MYRRALLAAMAGLAGCGEATAPDPTPDGREPAPRPTGTGPGPAPDATRSPVSRGIGLRNASGRRRFVTLAVDADGRSLFADSRPIPAGVTLAYGALVGPGRYRVVVETADGARHRRSWRPGPEAGDLAVTLDRTVESAVTATCAPDCGERSLGGRAPAYEGRVPAGTTVPAGTSAPTAASATDETDAPGARRLVLVRPAGTAPVTARVVFGPASAPDLDYRYRLGPATRLVLPAVAWEPRYRVTVEAGDGPAVRRWTVADGDRLYAVLDDGVVFRCANEYRDLTVLNRTDDGRRARIAVRADGRSTVAGSFSLGPRGGRTLPNAVAPARTYGFTVTTDDRIDERFETAVRPPPGRMIILLGTDRAGVTVRGERRPRVVRVGRDGETETETETAY